MSELTTGQFSVVHWADKKLDIVAHEISAEGVSHSFVIAKMSVECALALASKLIAESGYTLVK
jgi:hypothetical protein